MSLFKKLGALMLIVFTFVCAISLTSCGSSSGVDASLSAVSTATRVTVTATFGTNKNLKSGDAVPHIKQYKYNSDSDKYVYDDVDLELTFSSNIYTTAKETFTGLDESTKYQFKLYITYKSKDKKAAQIEVKTKASDEATEISTIEEFNAMSDDPSGDYILTADLDFDSIDDNEFKSPFDASTQFKGTFNGNGHTLSNIKFPTGNSNVGVFGYTNKASIFDLKINNVVADFTSGRSSADIGAVVGHATNTVLYNVTINNVDFDIQGNSTAAINIGGVVGLSEGSTLINCNVNGLDINFTRLRCKVSVGGLVGQAIKYSNETLKSYQESYSKSIEAANKANLEEKDSLEYMNTAKESVVADERILAYDCTVNAIKTDGDTKYNGISGSLYYLSKTDSGDAFAHVGGFIGDISTTNLVYDCVTNNNINLTRNESTSNDNRFSLAVGGFFGCNYTGTVRIKSCLADSQINVFAGSNPLIDDELSETEKAEKIANLNNTVLCESKDVTTDSDKNIKEPSREYAYIGAFGGKINEFVSVVEDCVYRTVLDGVNINNVYASEVRNTTDEEYKIVTENDWYSNLDVNDTTVINDVIYVITDIEYAEYYEIEFTKVDITADTFEANKYYKFANSTFTLIEEYEAGIDYYTLTATLNSTVDSTTDFNSNTYYIKDGTSYVLAEAFVENYSFGVVYLFFNEVFGKVDSTQGTRIGTLTEINVVSDTANYGNNVKDYLNK